MGSREGEGLLCALDNRCRNSSGLKQSMLFLLRAQDTMNCVLALCAVQVNVAEPSKMPMLFARAQLLTRVTILSMSTNDY